MAKKFEYFGVLIRFIGTEFLMDLVRSFTLSYMEPELSDQMCLNICRPGLKKHAVLPPQIKAALTLDSFRIIFKYSWKPFSPRWILAAFDQDILGFIPNAVYWSSRIPVLSYDALFHI